MQITNTTIDAVKIITPKVFSDSRGWFYESFQQAAFEAAIGQSVQLIQDNHSRSQQGVLRGLHYQRTPHAQAKLVRCTLGEIFDVAVDIRLSSPTFGKWVGVHLSAENKQQLWIPAGFAHGFLTLSDYAEVCYKTDALYAPSSDAGLAWNDSELAIDWPNIPAKIILSTKDAQNCTLQQARKQNLLFA